MPGVPVSYQIALALAGAIPVVIALLSSTWLRAVSYSVGLVLIAFCIGIFWFEFTMPGVDMLGAVLSVGFIFAAIASIAYMFKRMLK